jgi:pyruvate dehydrogenase phosphatase
MLVAHVGPEEVTTANAGDCRAVIGRRKTGKTGVTWEAIELSKDHQIDVNPAERKRLLKAHPDEPDVITHNRVKGRLEPTRGLGDGMYKRKEYFDENAKRDPNLARRYLGTTGWKPPYTTASPDITSHKLHPDDQFMVMATDGLFRDMSSDEVVQTVSQWIHYAGNPTGDVAKRTASSWLIEAALVRASADSHHRLVAKLAEHHSQPFLMNQPRSDELLSHVVQLPAGKKRGTHDDITVLVVFFDRESTPLAATPQ